MGLEDELRKAEWSEPDEASVSTRKKRLVIVAVFAGN
jgi:hypothetical protein